MQLAALGGEHVMRGTTHDLCILAVLNTERLIWQQAEDHYVTKQSNASTPPRQLLTTINQAILLHFHCVFEELSGMQFLSATPSCDGPRMSSVLINFATMLTVTRNCYPRQ